MVANEFPVVSWDVIVFDEVLRVRLREGEFRPGIIH